MSNFCQIEINLEVEDTFLILLNIGFRSDGAPDGIRKHVLIYAQRWEGKSV